MVLEIEARAFACRVSSHSLSCSPALEGFLFLFFFFFLSRQGFSVALEPVLELALCRPGWPRTHRDPHASASRVLGLKKGMCHLTQLSESLLTNLAYVFLWDRLSAFIICSIRDGASESCQFGEVLEVIFSYHPVYVASKHAWWTVSMSGVTAANVG